MLDNNSFMCQPSGSAFLSHYHTGKSNPLTDPRAGSNYKRLCPEPCSRDYPILLYTNLEEYSLLFYEMPCQTPVWISWDQDLSTMILHGKKKRPI